MSRDKVALGLMSGTSLDGVDAAILTTDGEKPDRNQDAEFEIPEPTSRDELPTQTE